MLVSTSGPRTRTCRCFARLWFCRGVFGWWSCGGVFVLVFLVFLWWWCGGGGGVFVVSTSGPRTRTFRCFARFWSHMLAANLICSGSCFHNP